ncbi:hypothetical protein [Streptomyces sp. NL15-2K]|uniref:hypothetical protein n=1 Tax=Streptomyces sp. NL15-2K TaxID=376149 RepID=UPI000F56DC07|nr:MULTISPECIES: hypothetical protein [Actinomycetes]WKX15181.1 hypothetical protein Q4V64_49880 [Kutzneria buriramensis]GCB52294.1 hypothetical protein SNL152K_9650 [Streptomyces sp. NL15-2K]
MSEGLAESGMVCAATRGGAEVPPDRSRCGFEQLSAVADAVLYEGYLLYPYRRSSAKNRVRWQFGVLFPRDWVESDGPVVPGMSGSADSWYQQTECLLRIRRPGASVRVRLRYLQMQRKQVQENGREGGHSAVESLRADDGTVHLTFEEAVPREVDVAVRMDDLLQGERTFAVGAAAGVDFEPLPGHAGRVVRRREEVQASTTVAAERLSPDLCRLRVRTTNTGAVPDPRTPRDEALRRALIATHTLIAGEGVEFVSLIDPPTDLRTHAGTCRNEFTFPVLGGEPPTAPAGSRGAQGGGTGHVLLSSPIILPDHPQVAPESPGDLHDAAEIDEILTLRTMLLTDEEKREARATDLRAAAILDRVETMPPEVFARLHGAVRSLVPVTPTTAAPAPERPAWWLEGADDGLSPSTDTVLVDGVALGGGSRVRLSPRGRGADAQDMFLAGRAAEVAAVFHDVDGSVHIAVTLDDDPASELHNWYGRFHYFRPDELEPLGPQDPRNEPPAPASAAAPARHTTDSETPCSGGR